MTVTQYRNIMRHVHAFMVEHDLDELVIHRRLKRRKADGSVQSRLTLTHYADGRIVEPIYDNKDVVTEGN